MDIDGKHRKAAKRVRKVRVREEDRRGKISPERGTRSKGSRDTQRCLWGIPEIRVPSCLNRCFTTKR